MKEQSFLIHKAALTLLVVLESGFVLQLRDDTAGIEAPNRLGLFGGSATEGDTSLRDTVKRELREELEDSSLVASEPKELLTIRYEALNKHGIPTKYEVLIDWAHINSRNPAVLEGQKAVFVGYHQDLNKLDHEVDYFARFAIDHYRNHHLIEGS